jgi:small-conductance mechanosensitive channel
VIDILGLSLPALPVMLAAAVIAALLVTAIAAFAFRLVGKRKEWARVLVKLIRVPFRMTVMIGALWIAVAGYLDAPADVDSTLGFIFRALFIASATWLVCALLFYAEEIAANRYRIDVRDNRVARRVRTQLRMLRRIGIVIIIICAIGTVLLSIPGAATVGASLFASAGLLSVVAGLAAQSTLANVFAGMQLAFNNALRVDDVVIVEGEWGKIEEITLTYIVVHIWDDRRMVLPSTYFTTTPFQNWTRHNSELLGSVEFDLDWRVNPAAMREELNHIVESTDLWDGRAVVLQVTDAVGGFVRVRVLVTAQDAPTLFDLRCLVRENLIDWVNAENPDALPMNRVEVRQEPVTAPVRPSSRARKPERTVIEPPGLFSGDEGGKERAQQFTESIPVQDWDDAPDGLPAPHWDDVPAPASR